MDHDALHSALLSLTLIPDQLRSARENLATGEDRVPAALTHLLCSTEHDVRVAKATLADALGFASCRCCWWPELLTIDARGSYCPATGRVHETSRSHPAAAHEFASFTTEMQPRRYAAPTLLRVPTRA